MWSRYVIAAAVGLGMASEASAAEPNLVHRASCTVVRYYVAKYTAPAAEAWARSKGATEAEIEAARRCIKDSPAQTAQVASPAAQN
jgi:hypothetical protein